MIAGRADGFGIGFGVGFEAFFGTGFFAGALAAVEATDENPARPMASKISSILFTFAPPLENGVLRHFHLYRDETPWATVVSQDTAKAPWATVVSQDTAKADSAAMDGARSLIGDSSSTSTAIRPLRQAPRSTS
jgi:hypothetical protein